MPLPPKPDLSAATLRELFPVVCTGCRDERPLRQREATGEWVHEWENGGNVRSIQLCFATHLRTRYKDTLGNG